MRAVVFLHAQPAGFYLHSEPVPESPRLPGSFPWLESSMR